VTPEGEFICSDWCQRHDYTSYGKGINLQLGIYSFAGWVTGPCIQRAIEQREFKQVAKTTRTTIRNTKATLVPTLAEAMTLVENRPVAEFAPWFTALKGVKSVEELRALGETIRAGQPLLISDRWMSNPPAGLRRGNGLVAARAASAVAEDQSLLIQLPTGMVRVAIDNVRPDWWQAEADLRGSTIDPITAAVLRDAVVYADDLASDLRGARREKVYTNLLKQMRLKLPVRPLILSMGVLRWTPEGASFRGFHKESWDAIALKETSKTPVNYYLNDGFAHHWNTHAGYPDNHLPVAEFEGLTMLQEVDTLYGNRRWITDGQHLGRYYIGTNGHVYADKVLPDSWRAIWDNERRRGGLIYRAMSVPIHEPQIEFPEEFGPVRVESGRYILGEALLKDQATETALDEFLVTSLEAA
jgi:hypothetical protein